MFITVIPVIFRHCAHKDAHNQCLQSTFSLSALTTNLYLKAAQERRAERGGEQTLLGLSSQEATTPKPVEHLEFSHHLHYWAAVPGDDLKVPHNLSHPVVSELSRTADPGKGSAAAQGSCGTISSLPLFFQTFQSKTQHIKNWSIKKAVPHNSPILLSVLSQLQVSKPQRNSAWCFWSSPGNTRKDWILL